MPILPTGAGLATNITFNSGTLDINGLELGVIQDITITLSWSEKEIRGLGSIKMFTAPKRYGFKPMAKGKVKSFNKELYSFFMGSSGTDGTGFIYSVLDGQNVLSRASMKFIVNESTGQTAEFQFTNAILSANLDASLKMEDAGEFAFEIKAQDVNLVTNFTT